MSEVSDTVTLAAHLVTAYEGFDPSLHATNPDGSPRMKKGGGFALKRGRKAGTAVPSHAQSTITADPANPSAGQAQISNQEASKMLCAMVCAGLQGVMGPEWEPSTAEAKALVDGTRAYLDATGGMDMSPATGLLFVWGGFGIPRLAMPETQSKLKKFGSWFAGLFSRKKA